VEQAKKNKKKVSGGDWRHGDIPDGVNRSKKGIRCSGKDFRRDRKYIQGAILG
jgi:hypothetical protein